MLKTQMMPLRHTVGKPIFITSVQVTGAATGLTIQNIQQKRWQGMDSSFLNDPIYAQFLPAQVRLGSRAYVRGPGVAVMTPPSDLPFAPVPFHSLWTMGAEVGSEDLSRKLWVEYRLNLATKGGIPLVGGICYGGYPYMPYYVTPQGENSSNFGLPREIRVSWAGQNGGEFLDDEVSLTQQEPASHSGVHIFPTGPIKTDHLILRLSDFSRIITNFVADQVVEQWGFIIPYIFVYAYKEQTRYQAHVPAGLLAAIHTRSIGPATPPIVPPAPQPARPPNLYTHYYFERQMASNSDDVKRKYAFGSADYIFVKTGRRVRPQYFPSAGASIFQDVPDQNASARRKYTLDQRPELDERFGTNKLEVDDEVYLFIEQSEEQPRCLAGLRIAFDDQNLTNDPDLIPGIPVAIRVYELDPPEGVSPLALDERVEANKYATLIATLEPINTNKVNRQVRFVRPSSSRFFVIVLQALAEGHILVNSLELVQSVHVAVTPRASRRQAISAMHFRLIGPELAEDYAQLGSDGFSFSVEHLVAGQTKNVLFSANSLLDLLQTGAARLYSNHRRRMVEKEISQTQNGSYSVQHTATRAKGWNRSETGDGVADPDFDWLSVLDNDQASNDHTNGYSVLGNQETRHHQKHVLGRTISHAGEINLIDQLLDVMGPLYSDFVNEFSSNNDDLWEDSQGQVWLPWNNIDTDLLRVTGVWNATVPPGWQAELEYARSFIDAINNLATLNPFSLDEIRNLFFGAITPERFKNLLATNGFGLSLGVGFGASGSVSANLGLPTFVKSGALGATGNVARQASKTHFSYAQYRNNRFDQLRTRTEYPEGTMIRQVRREAAGNDTERVKGAEVMWQNQLVDIVTGTIPLNAMLPATAGNIYRTTDEVIRVRLGGGFRDSLSVDFWFDVREEVIRDDY